MSTHITTNIPIAQQLIDICKTNGLKHIIISPGSRNAALTIGFTNDNFFNCYSIVDERCAAFFALGIAQQIQQPVALVCTSGSALLNYYPAIAEAFYSDIPLVVLSADRPKEAIDIGDGQTIRQEYVFKNHILNEANLTNALEYSNKLALQNEVLISEALDVALIEQGPVHINIPFYEPLYGTEEKTKTSYSQGVVEEGKIDFKLEPSFGDIWAKASKKLVLVGVLPPNQLSDAILDELLSDPSVLLLTETTSNLHHNKYIPSIDQLIAQLSAEEQKELQPELLVTFGGLIVSKKIKSFLRKYQPQNHWHIDTKKAYDTFGSLTAHVKASPAVFLKELLNSYAKTDSGYQSFWLDEYKQRLIGHKAYLNTIPYCDLKVFDAIFKQLPKNLHLQLSNSSTIRYAQLFQLNKGMEVFCNRGTSGIDGSTSTAIGAAIIQQKPTVLITGDLSFFYDSNALWNKYIPDNFKIIIINNGGGGIFRILPGNKKANYFENFLETTHDLKADHLAAMYGFDYFYADEANIDMQLTSFFKQSSKSILEIHTPRTVNDLILLEYFVKIKE